MDTVQKTAYSIQAEQKPCVSALKQEHKTLINHYLSVVQKHHLDLEKLSSYLVVDSFLAKKKFLKELQNGTNLFIISKLRIDADARYLYQGAPTGKQGTYRPFININGQGELCRNFFVPRNLNKFTIRQLLIS